MSPVPAVREVGIGRPLVLLPWFSLDAEVMAAAFEPALVGVDGLRRIYVDLPGVGATPPVAASSDAVVAGVIELLSGLDEPVVLAGCSYGGYLAAAVTRRRPELVRGLALVCSGIRIRIGDRTLPDARRTTPLPWNDHEVEPWLQSHLDLALATDDFAVARRVADLVAGVRNDEAYLSDLRDREYAVSDEDDPSAYQGPVLMVAGRQDRVGGYVDQFDAMTRYPHGTYAVVDGAGHYLPFEQPDAFAGLLRPWLADLGDRQPRAGE